jgi:hypothetical protein
MKQFIIRFIIVGMAFLMAGCFGREVRHLSSDVSMIQIGSSGKHDVLIFLGEPDTSVILSPSVEEWTYYEDKTSVISEFSKEYGVAEQLGKIPYLERFASGDESYDMVVITLENDIVTTCRFAVQNSGEYTDKTDHFPEK